MKKVAILLPWLKMGGTNKVALRFARELSQYCDVTLILSSLEGELLEEVPEGVRLQVDHMTEFRDIVKSDLKRFRLQYLYKDTVYYLNIKRKKDDIDNYRYLADRSGDVSREIFDCAISYHGQSPERLVNLITRIHARKKVVWIHGEMSFPKPYTQKMQKYYDRVDHFFFVSDATRKAFEKVISVNPDKTTVYYNPLDKAEIIAKAKQPFTSPFSTQSIHLLTVGRISSEKGQDMIPSITKALIREGYPVDWYIIGDGPNRNHIEELIQKCRITEHVHLLGTKENPYSYMKACDIYVQPSYTEGYSTTICEAGVLEKPIIGTRQSGGIREQITDGVDGLIVDASIDRLKKGIEYLIDHPEIRREFGNKIGRKNFEGKGEIQKFLAIMS